MAATGRRKLIGYTAAVTAISIAYYAYIVMGPGVKPEQETFLSEIGEVFGELALWMFGVIYGRTLFKIALGKGKLAKRLLPEYKAPKSFRSLKGVLAFLNRTHNYVGIAAVCLIFLHVALVGFPMEILFFPAVLALVVWQALFGIFLAWKYSSAELKKFSYLVHAQFATGIMIGIFAWFGHMLVD